MKGITIKNVESQLEMGKKVEQEHKPTWDKIKSGKITTPEAMYESIAIDHLNEYSDYYNRLKQVESK